jgi:L-threonylcarbamoyladenylate synthase
MARVVSSTPGPLGESDARRLEECLASGGVAVFPADTVYGVCCDPDDERAARRLYELKGRPAERPAAVMFFALEPALSMLSELRDTERAAMRALLPGPVTLLLPNPRLRFGPACGPDPTTLGLRVPRLPAHLTALRVVGRPAMQSSANLTGEADARRLIDVPESIRAGADLVLDGGELPGTPSTVVDLCDYQQTGEWRVLRAGALERSALERLLA